ncbi:MAG: DUF533 domain-containing protein [Deltaproteobacteria bacterium]|nr:DUF533 domain-containing protein [Deltaproteobacteria bacterium]
MGILDILNNGDLREKLKDLTEQVKSSAQEMNSTSGNWGDKLKNLTEQIKNSAQELGESLPGDKKTKALVGAGALGALLGVMFPKTVKAAGLAGAGAVAWYFYKKWAAQKNAQTSAANGEPSAKQDSLDLQDPAAMLLLQVMIAAARADGHIDAEEQSRITALVQQMFPEQDTASLLKQLETATVEPADIARQVNSVEQGEDVYRLSCLIIDIDEDAERRYMDTLAQALNISEERMHTLEGEAREARQKLAAL